VADPPAYRPQRAWFERWGLTAAELDMRRPVGRSVRSEGFYWSSVSPAARAAWNACIIRRREADRAYLEQAATGKIGLLGYLMLPGQPVGELAPPRLPPPELRRCRVGHATDRLIYHRGAIELLWTGMVWCDTSRAAALSRRPSEEDPSQEGKLVRRVELIFNSETEDKWPSKRARKAEALALEKAERRKDPAAIEVLTDNSDDTVFKMWRAARALRDTPGASVQEIVRRIYNLTG
jgi:hypothetical protein